VGEKMNEINNFIKENMKWFLLGLIGVIVLLLVLLFWQGGQNHSEDESTEIDVYEELLLEEEEGESDNEQEVAVEEPPSEMMVDVKGAVQNPGVYTMPVNSRVVDAIDKAGGMNTEAEQNAVNLAQIVEDQMVIYVPTEDEATQNGTVGVMTGQTNNEENNTDTIDINSAEKEALMTLNGIGSSKADNIITYREENGNFQTIEDIKNVSGIGEATFDNLKDFIRVSP